AIVGALPYFRKTDPEFGSVFNSLPWYGSHGGCIVSEQDAESVRRELLDAFRSQLDTPELIASTLILSPYENELRATYEAAISPTAFDHRIGQITSLPEPGEGLEGRLESVLLQKTRNLVRKARRQGFVEAVSDDEWAWRFLHEVHLENMSAIGGKAKPWPHFASLREQLPREGRRLSIALYRDEPVAGMLLVLFNRTVEYVTPAIRYEYRSLQPLSFLIWQGMLEVGSRGFKWWNWGGTWKTQDSLHHFKAGWGAQEWPYTYLVSVGRHRLPELQSAWSKIAPAFPFYFVYPLSQLR
ncbi:MAG: GNAT family N-acetyltransferase, partial [Pyrinomonadaceae bacterium]